MTLPGDCVAGHVGAPLPCNRVKLVDVKEMNYFAENGEGEVSSSPLLLHPHSNLPSSLRCATMAPTSSRGT